jgi:hypothetical protein
MKSKYRTSSQLFAIVVLLIAGFWNCSVGAQERFTLITEAADAATSWFTKMLGSVGELARAEDKRRLLVALTKLNKKLYDLEQNKRYLADSIRREGTNRLRVDMAVKDLQPSLDGVSSAIAEVSPLLRQQFRIDGNEVEDALRRSVGDQKDWVYNPDIILAVEGVDGIKRKLNASVESLHAAGLALTKLIDALEKQIG